MSHNRYFTIQANDPNIDKIMFVCVGELNTQRPSVDKTKLIVKLNENDHNEYEFLKKYPEYNYDEVIKELSSPFWTIQIPSE